MYILNMNVIQKFEKHTSLSPKTFWGIGLRVVVLAQLNYINIKFHTSGKFNSASERLYQITMRFLQTPAHHIHQYGRVLCCGKIENIYEGELKMSFLVKGERSN